MTTTEKKLESAREAVGRVLEHFKIIFTNGQALLARAESNRVAFLNRAQSACGDGDPLNIDRGWPSVDGLLQSDAVQNYLASEAVAKAITESPEYIEAESILTPLIANVLQLEVALAAEREAAGIVAAQRAAALEAATAEALAAVNARFALPEEQEPAKEEPAPPFRGKGIKPALATA